MEYFAEEVLQMFVAFQWRSVVVCVLDLFAESETLIAFVCKLLSECSLLLAFDFERVLMHQQKEEQHSGCPNIHLVSITIVLEVFRSQERGRTYFLKHPLPPFDKLCH